MRRLLPVSLTLLALIAIPLSAAAQPDPPAARFGSGIVLINPHDEGMAFYGSLSPNGRYVVGAGGHNSLIPPNKHLFAWDLSAVGVDDPPRVVEPVASRLFADFGFTEEVGFSSRRLAISPDSATAAVVLDTTVYVLNLPDLSTRETYLLPDNLPDLWSMVKWSADGTLLAAVYTDWSETSIIVIEPDTGTLHRFDTANIADAGLTTFKDGWLVCGGKVFVLCTGRLESCTEYPLMSRCGITYDPRNDALITTSGSHAAPALAWTGPDFASLTPDARLYAALEGLGTPTSFSPSGQYITMMYFQHYIPQYAHWWLWDVDQHTMLHEVGAIRAPVWLGVDNYFLHGGGQNLGHPTTEEWIDALPSLFDIAFETGDSDTYHIALYQVFHEHIGVNSVATDGTRYLLTLGWVAIVVPVIYE